MAKKKKGDAAPPEATKPAKRISACDAVQVPLSMDFGMFKRVRYKTDTPEERAAAEAHERTYSDPHAHMLYLLEETKRVADRERDYSKNWPNQTPRYQDAYNAQVLLQEVMRLEAAGEYQKAISTAIRAGMTVLQMWLRDYDEDVKNREKAAQSRNDRVAEEHQKLLAVFKTEYERLAALNPRDTDKELRKKIKLAMNTLLEARPGDDKLPESTFKRWKREAKVSRRRA